MIRRLSNRIKKAIRSRLGSFVKSVLYDEMGAFVSVTEQVKSYKESSEVERQGYYNKTRDPLALKRRFIKANVPVEDVDINIDDFNKWLNDFAKPNNFYSGIGDIYVEKCLEHYLVYKELKLSKEDVYIDIAASGSLWADMLKMYGFNGYKLDLVYSPGIHGNKIGADAGDMKLPDGFASAMSLQCAFETFQGDADIRFIREAERVLNEKGRFAIVPLYIDDKYIIISSPYCDLSTVDIDNEAVRVWREDGYKVPFSRHYSPEGFTNRIYSQLEVMSGKIIFFNNLDAVKGIYPDQRVYCNFMFYSEK